jgi:hypothetical protein
VPLAPAGWKEGDPVQIIVEFPRIATADLPAWIEERKKEETARPQTEVSGYLLPLPQRRFRAWFPKLQPAEHVQVLYVSGPDDVEPNSSMSKLLPFFPFFVVIIPFGLVAWWASKQSVPNKVGEPARGRNWEKLVPYQPHVAVFLSIILIMRLAGAVYALADVINAPNPLPVDEWKPRGTDGEEAVVDGRVLTDELVFERTFFGGGKSGRHWIPYSVVVEAPLVGPNWQASDPVRAIWSTSVPLDCAAAWHRELASRPIREADVSVRYCDESEFRKVFLGLKPTTDTVVLQSTVRSSTRVAGPDWTDLVLIALLGAVLGPGTWMRQKMLRRGQPATMGATDLLSTPSEVGSGD